MPSRVRQMTIFGPTSIMLFRQIIHFGERQWNSCSRRTSNFKLKQPLGTGSLHTIPMDRLVRRYSAILNIWVSVFVNEPGL